MSSNHQKAVAKGRGSLAINAAQYANVTVYQYVTYAGDRVSVRETIDPSRCPYPGLETFRTSEAKYFAGREDDVAELEAKLRDHDICGVIAASGAGKSSLVHAGLIPALAERETEAWDVFAFKPGQEPLYGLARSMSGVLAEAETRRGQFDEIDATVADLRETPGRLRRYIQAIASRRVEAADGKHHHVLIFVDQWEELYTRENDEDRDILVRELMDVAERGLAKVLLTMRIDFMDDLVSKSTEFYDVLEPAVRILRPLGETGRRAAIEKPAEVAGLRVPPELTSRLVADLGKDEGTLPYLQFVLRQLWEKRDKETNSLTTATYDSMDGLKGAIGAHADDVFRKLSKEEQGLAQRVLPRLANVSDIGITSRRLPFADFDESARKLLRRLAEPDARLIVLSSATEDVAEAEIVAEVAHEALLDDWKTLSGWIEDRKDFFRLRNKLEADAKTWIENDKNPEFLIPSGKPLLDAQDLQTKALPSDFSAALDAFISMSVEKKKQDDKRRQDEEAARRKAEAEQLQKEKEQALERERLATELSQTESARANEAEESERTLKTRNKWLMGLAAVSVTVAVGAGYFWNQSILARGVAEKARLDAEANAARAELATQEADKQRNTADMERVAAEQSAREAKGKELAARARILQEEFSDPKATDLAAALAIEAWMRSPSLEAFVAAENASKRLPILRVSHAEIVTRAQFVDQGKRIVTLSGSDHSKGIIRIFSAKDGIEIYRSDDGSSAKSFEISSTGNQIAILFSNSVDILNSRSGDLVARKQFNSEILDIKFLTKDSLMLGNQNKFWEWNFKFDEIEDIFLNNQHDKLLRVSNNYKILALQDNSGTLSLRSIDGVYEVDLVAMEGEIGASSFDATGSLFAAGDNTGSISVYSTSTGAIVEKLELGERIDLIKFGQDGRFVAGVAENGQVHFREIGGRENTHRLQFERKVNWLGFSKNEEFLVIAAGPSVHIVETNEGKEVGRIDHERPVWSVDVDAERGRLLTASGRQVGQKHNDASIFLFDGGYPRFKSGSAAYINQVKFNSESQLFAFGNSIGEIWEVDAMNQSSTLSYDLDGEVWALEFSPDGNHLAAVTLSGNARLFEVESGKEVLRIQEPKLQGVAVSFDQFGKVVAFGFRNGSDGAGKIRVHDISEGNEIASLDVPHNLRYMSLSPNGSRIAFTVDRWKVTAIDVANNSPILEYDLVRQNFGNRIKFNNSGNSIAVASSYGRAIVLDTIIGNERYIIEHDVAVDFVLFSSDDNLLISADEAGVIEISDASSGERVSRFEMGEEILDLKLNSDGSILAVSSVNGLVRMVDTRLGQEIARYSLDAPVYSIDFDRSDLFLAAGGEDGIARLFPGKPDILFDRLCKYRHGSNLTDDQWSQYIDPITVPVPTCNSWSP